MVCARPRVLAVLAPALLAGGCGSAESDPPAAQGERPPLELRRSTGVGSSAHPSPTGYGGVLVSLPWHGTLVWRCRAGARRIEMALRVPSGHGTITGTVATPRSASTAFRAHPGQAISTGFLDTREVRWRLSYRHKPAQRTATVTARFGSDPHSGDCLVTAMNLREVDDP